MNRTTETQDQTDVQICNNWKPGDSKYFSSHWNLSTVPNVLFYTHTYGIPSWIPVSVLAKHPPPHLPYLSLGGRVVEQRRQPLQPRSEHHPADLSIFKLNEN